MDINNKARIHWACRRGMRELDISIMPFFEYEYDTLSDADKQLFIRLLENDDPDLFNWLMNHGKPADAELQRMVTLIQTRNPARTASLAGGGQHGRRRVARSAPAGAAKTGAGVSCVRKSVRPFRRGSARTSSGCARRSGRTGWFHPAPGQRTVGHRRSPVSGW